MFTFDLNARDIMENLFRSGRIHLISLRWGCWQWSRPWLTMRSWSQS